MISSHVGTRKLCLRYWQESLERFNETVVDKLVKNFRGTTSSGEHEFLSIASASNFEFVRYHQFHLERSFDEGSSNKRVDKET